MKSGTCGWRGSGRVGVRSRLCVKCACSVSEALDAGPLLLGDVVRCALDGGDDVVLADDVVPIEDAAGLMSRALHRDPLWHTSADPVARQHENTRSLVLRLLRRQRDDGAAVG